METLISSRVGGRPRQLEDRPCVTCGTLFRPPQSKSRFCSRICYYRHQHVAERGINKSTVVEERPCLVCGEKFLVGGIGNRPRTVKYCSVRCRSWGVIKTGRQVAHLSDTEAAYLAGLVDGEGSILLYRRGETAKMRLCIANTFIEVLEWTKRTTGVGSVIVKKATNVEHKRGGMWFANSEVAAAVIRQIEPYLIVKKAQAGIALDFQTRLHEPSLKANVAWQTQYLAKMQLLNKRG